jgi:hypothetical protein
MRQALADLAAAVGDPAVALGTGPTIGKLAAPLPLEGRPRDSK